MLIGLQIKIIHKRGGFFGNSIPRFPDFTREKTLPSSGKPPSFHRFGCFDLTTDENTSTLPMYPLITNIPRNPGR